jgi:hypothetical protein
LIIDSGVPMKRYLQILTLAGLIIGGPFALDDSLFSLAQGSSRFVLQLSSFSTMAAAQKEIERLKSFKITTRYMTKQDSDQKEWFIVYTNHYQTREEAARQGSRFIKEGIIRDFFIFPMEVKEEPPLKTKGLAAPGTREAPTASSIIPSEREIKPISGKIPIYFGPVTIKEEENSILITISLSQKIFPKITTQKHENNSHLLITFKDIDKSVVPIDFRKEQAQVLLSFSLLQEDTDCTLALVLNSSFNYEVSQNYFEKEKIYSLRIRWGSTEGLTPVIEK